MEKSAVSIGLVGDYDDSVPAHQAIPQALETAARVVGVEVCYAWVPTEKICVDSKLGQHDGIWCVPASPYRSMDGALHAIRFARERGVPFLGTCGGFQHAIIEYARNVLGWLDADHAETAPESARSVISPLSCDLIEATGTVRFVGGSRIALAYGVLEAVEGYRCRYGLNPDFRAALISGPLRVDAEDETGEVRGVELDGHPFFVATLFQPERAALRGHDVPLAKAFVRAARGG